MPSFRHFHSHHRSELDTDLINTIHGDRINLGWRYDLIAWVLDTFFTHGKLRQLRQRTINLASLQPGEKVLDVGCGTGTLAIEVQKQVGATGYVAGIDPGAKQIARARFKAVRRSIAIDFQIGVIEHIPFPDKTFDVVLSTLMLHHVPADLRQQGFSEIMRALKPGGRLVIADFNQSQTQHNPSQHFGGVRDLPNLVKDAGFLSIETEEMTFSRFLSDVIFVKAYKR